MVDIYEAIRQVPWYIGLSIFVTVLILASNWFDMYLTHIRKKGSDVHIRQRHETGAVLQQENSMDIDLFLYAENRGDLNGKLAYGGMGSSVTFHGPDGVETLDSSQLGMKTAKLQFPSSTDEILEPGRGSSLVLRLVFPKDGRMYELLSQYDRAEIPWYISVTEGSGDYTVTGRAAVL